MTLDAPETIAAALIILGAATVAGTVAFGLGITATPWLLLMLEPQTVVILVNAISVLTFALIIIQTRQVIPFREAAPLALPALLGAPLGVWILSVVSAGVLRVTIALVILALTVFVVFNFRSPATWPKTAGPIVGFIVGAMIAALGIGGPIMVLFLLGRGWSSQALRGLLAVLFLSMSALAMVGYGVAGLYSVERIALILVAIVPALIGFRIASLLLERMNEAVFRRGVLAVIILSSLMILTREAISL